MIKKKHFRIELMNGPMINGYKVILDFAYLSRVTIESPDSIGRYVRRHARVVGREQQTGER